MRTSLPGLPRRERSVVVRASETLARALRRALEIREESFDHAAARDAGRFAAVNRELYYWVRLESAAATAAAECGDPSLGQAVYCMLKYMPEKATAWTDSVIGGAPP